MCSIKNLKLSSIRCVGSKTTNRTGWRSMLLFGKLMALALGDLRFFFSFVYVYYYVASSFLLYLLRYRHMLCCRLIMTWNCWRDLNVVKIEMWVKRGVTCCWFWSSRLRHRVWEHIAKTFFNRKVKWIELLSCSQANYKLLLDFFFRIEHYFDLYK